jgi:hypothetical protein
MSAKNLLPPIKYHAVNKDTGQYGVYETLEEARLNCDDDNWEVRFVPTIPMSQKELEELREYNDAENAKTKEVGE